MEEAIASFYHLRTLYTYHPHILEALLGTLKLLGHRPTYMYVCSMWPCICYIPSGITLHPLLVVWDFTALCRLFPTRSLKPSERKRIGYIPTRAPPGVVPVRPFAAVLFQGEHVL